MDPDENDDKADYERDAARSASVVESLEENKGGDNGTGREANIIKRVDAGRSKEISSDLTEASKPRLTHLSKTNLRLY